MSRFTDRLEQDLQTIADRAAPSPNAWEAIRQRATSQEPDQEVEMIMLSPDHEPNTGRRRIWWAVAAAAAIVVAVVAGVVISRDDEDGSMVSRPDTTEPAPEEPDAVEPDTEQTVEDSDAVEPDTEQTVEDSDAVEPDTEQPVEDPDAEQPVEDPDAEEPAEQPVEDPALPDGTDGLGGPPTSVELVNEIPNVLRPPRNPNYFTEGVLAGSNTGAYEVFDVTTGEKLGSGPYGQFVFLPGAIVTLGVEPETVEIRDLSDALVGEPLESASFPVAGSDDAVMMGDGTVFLTGTGEMVAEVEEGWTPLRVYERNAVLANEDTRTLRAVTVPDLETVWEVDDIVVDRIVPGALTDTTTGVTVSVDTGEVIDWVPDEARPAELCPDGTDGATDGGAGGSTEVSLESSAHAPGYWATIVVCGAAGSDTVTNTLVVFSDVDGSVIASIDVGEVGEVYADGRYVVTEPAGDESTVEVYLVS